MVPNTIIFLADSSIKDNYTQSITTPLSKSRHVYVSSAYLWCGIGSVEHNKHRI